MGIGVIQRTTDIVGVKNIAGSQIDPATEGTLAAVLAAVDGLELSVDNIDIDMDDVETLLTATNAALASLETANDASGDDIVSALTTLQSALQGDLADIETDIEAFKAAFDARDLATEAKQDSIITELQDIESDVEGTNTRLGEVSATPTANTVLARLKDIYESVDGLELSVDNIDIDLDSTNTLLTTIDSVLDELVLNVGDETDVEATGDGSVIAVLKRLRTRLDQLITDFNAEDFASETTLSSFAAANTADLNAIEADVEAFKAAFDARDLATEAKQDTIITALNAIDANTDTLESLLTDIDGNTDGIEGLLGTVNTNLSNLIAEVDGLEESTGTISDSETANTVIGRLKKIVSHLEDLDANTDNIEGLLTSIGTKLDTVNTNLGTIDTTLTDASQLTGVLGEDGLTIADQDNPVNVKPTGPAPLDSANSTKTPLQPGSFTAFTVDAGTDIFTSAAHGLSDGDPIVVKSDDTLPDGIVADQIYYVSDSTTNTFKLKSASPNNILAAYVDVTDTGTGTHSWAAPGSFEGEWTRIDRHADLFMFAFTTGAAYGGVEVQWSSDGVTQNTDALPISDLKAGENTDTPGFYIYLDTLTTDIDNYYRVVAYSGSGTMTIGDLRTWVYPDGFHGTFLGLSDSLSSLSTALLTRAVVSGNLLDDDLVDSGNFGNAFLTSTNNLIVADPPYAIFEDDSSLSGPLPSGAYPAWDPVGPIVASNVIDSGWINISQWNYQIFHSVMDQPGVDIFIIDAQDDQGNGSITAGFDFPTRTTKGVGTSDDIGATAFHDYLRIIVVNNSGSTVTDWTLRSRMQRVPVGPVFLPLDAEIQDFFPAPLGQNTIRARNAAGSHRNVRASDTDALVTRDEKLTVTQSGSLFTEGITSHVNHIFSRDKGVAAIARMNKVSAAGTITHDTAEGRAVIATSATNGEVAYFETEKTLRYDEAAHMMRYELTGEIPQWPLTGDEEILVGPMEDDGSEGILNGICHGFDATGYFTTRFKAGTEVAGTRTYSDDFNRNPLDADDLNNLFRFSGTPQDLEPSQNNYFLGYFEWLGIAPPTYGVQSPGGDPIVTHIEETPNNITGTILQEPNIPIGIRIQNDSSSGRVLEYHVGSIRGGTHDNKAVQQALDPNNDFRDVRAPFVHDGNSTNAPLNGDTGGSDHIWRGEWFKWQGPYVGLSTEVDSDVTGTLFIDYYLGETPVDGDDSTIAFSTTRPYSPADGVGVYRGTVPTQSLWVRLRYVNGTTAQSLFDLNTAFITVAIPDETEVLTIAPTDSSLAGVERTVDFAKDAVDGDYDQVYRTGNSRNTHITGDKSYGRFEGLSDVVTRSFVLTDEEQRIDERLDAQDDDVPRYVKVVNAGAFHAFIREGSGVTENNGEPLFLGGWAGMLLQPGHEVWGICEDTGGDSNIVDLESVSNTAGGTATSPTNAEVSNDSRAIRDAVGETLTMEDFSHTLTAGYVYDRVRIKHEARKSLTPATQTIAHEETQVGEQTGGTSVSSASLAGGTNQAYVVFVTRNDLNSISDVSGGGLTFESIVTNVSAGGRHIDAWYATGDPTSGIVTASMSSSTRAEIAVHRLSGVNQLSPIEASGSATGTGTSVTGPSIAKTDLGLGLLGVSHEAATATPGAGYTERSDETGGTGSNTVSLATETKGFTSTGTEAATMSLASSTDWAAIGVALTPASTVDPIETLSYTYNAVAGETSAQKTWANTSDATQFVDITADLDLGTFDPGLVKITSTVDTIGDADLESDLLSLEIRESTGATTRVVVVQGRVEANL